MRIGTAEPGSTFLSQGNALKQLLDSRAIGQPIEVVTALSASIENAQGLGDGAIQFGFMASNWIGRALRGEAPFKDKIELRMVAPANAGPLFFIALAASPMRTVAELRGKRICVGPATSGMAQHADTMFRALGWTKDDVQIVNLDFAQGAEALKRGEVDAQLQCPIPNRVMNALDASAELRVLEWASDFERLLAFQPLYRPATIRAGQLRCVKLDTRQPAVVNVIVTHASVDAALVKAVTAAIAGEAATLVAMEPLYAGLPDLFPPLKTQGRAAFEFGGVPLHEGAVAAYREAGLLA
ncbi:MAG: TAXI family TRAP transporter solute-binding subunit [Beijerinckiaceae bacterium]|nr:TAXI family TRAP transporter solute-binding subunit [Beijerinckiaceae bacterium]